MLANLPGFPQQRSAAQDGPGRGMLRQRPARRFQEQHRQAGEEPAGD